MSGKDSNLLDFKKIVGIIYIGTSTISIVFQILIFYIFYKKKFLLQNTVYKLILLLSIFEFLSEISHFSSGISSILNRSIPIFLERFLGSLLQTSFMLTILTTFFLTLNRFYIFFRNILPEINNLLPIKIITIIITIAFGISLFVTYLFHEYGLQYNIDICSWHYIMDQVDPIPIFKFEYIYTLTILTICFVFYIVIFLKISSQRFINNKSRIFSSSDIRILIHIIFIFLFILILETLWWYLRLWFDDFLLTSIILNYAWIVSSGMNTILNIIFISQIFNEFLRIITCQNFKVFKNDNKSRIKILTVKNISEKAGAGGGQAGAGGGQAGGGGGGGAHPQPSPPDEDPNKKALVDAARAKIIAEAVMNFIVMY
uniref:G_PROTEIN_RECEP_F1_2 domain-containing protein n=1 Tax=Strongyloides stercoralis TaxID=6248 RepID=A0A0K0DZE3_STRER